MKHVTDPIRFLADALDCLSKAHDAVDDGFASDYIVQAEAEVYKALKRIISGQIDLP